MTIEEIDAKIAELRAKRDSLREQINALYEKRSKDPFTDKVDKLYNELSELDAEIKAYTEAKVLKITTDDLVEEEYQGNVPAEASGSLSERAKMFFNLSDDEWAALSEDEKKDYINKLPPEKTKDGDCTYDWVTVREKLLDSLTLDPMKLSSLLSEMDFDNEKGTVSMKDETIEKLKELNVDLEKCEPEEGEEEQDDYEEFIKPHLAEDAVMSYAQKKALPDSAYAYIEAGCKKEDGKTQQSCRHMPIHDEAHVRAALAALGGARTGKVPSYASKAKPKVCAAAKKFKIESEVCGTKGEDLPSTEEVLKDAKRVWDDKTRIIG